MRISELSTVAGVPVATIKYYLRENLLAPGLAIGPNQASYDDGHARRLRLIRALLDVGGLSVASARAVITAVDSPEVTLPHVLATAQLAVSESDLYVRQPSDAARRRVDELVSERRWRVSAENPGRVAAANIIDTFESIGRADLIGLIDEYAKGAEIVARADIQVVGAQPDLEAMADTVVAGTVLGDALVAALRRIAQEHETTTEFPDGMSEGTAR